MAAKNDHDSLVPFKPSWQVVSCICVVSFVYFADVFLKASRKCFWFDELFTVYLCRLPDFQSTWAAVKHGADFNPPLLYLLTRVSQRAFGEGLVATRLPAIVGVWVFCFCLFVFVSRRVGPVAGFIAGALPFFTIAQYYAYEARAHGIVLGWCGLALVCWQSIKAGANRYVWLAGFGLSLVCALLTHVYAVYLFVPFFLVEAVTFVRQRLFNWQIVAVMATALCMVVGLVYLPMSRVYKQNVPAVFFPATHDAIQKFLVGAIGPALIVLLLFLLFVVLDGTSSGAGKSATASEQEVTLAIGFLSIPVLGLVGCKLSHGPFFDRYFLSNLAGYAILLAFACAGRPRVARAMAGCLFALMLADWGSTLYLSSVNRVVLFEPSTGLSLSTIPSHPMQSYETLSGEPEGNGADKLDTLILTSLDYVYCASYAPSSVASRLYFVAAAKDVNRGGIERLKNEAHADLKTTSVEPFLATHPHFLLYETPAAPKLESMQAVAAAGYQLKSARGDASGILYEYER